MSGLEAAAAVIGITDVAVRSILSVYDYCKKLHEAPEAVGKLRDEVMALVRCLESLDFLKTASQDVRDKIVGIGVTTSVESCGKTCASLEEDLKRWTSGGVQALLGKMKVVRHEAKVERYRAEISTAKSTITLGVSSASLWMLVDGESVPKEERKAKVLVLKAEIDRLTNEAKREHEKAEQLQGELQKRLEQDDDAECESVEVEVGKRKGAYEQLLLNCGIAGQDLRESASVHVEVKDAYASDWGTNEAGVAKEYIDRVREARIKSGTLTATRGGRNRIGVF